MTEARTRGPEATAGTQASPGRWPWAALAVLGIALAAAPLVFGMFSRAPGGGRMLDDFRPFMSEQRLDTFSGYLDTIDAATAEADGPLRSAVSTAGGPDLPATTAMAEQWPDIEEEMRGMLADIRANIDRFEAVDALPPFALFPWFFVLPGLLLAGLAGAAWRRSVTARPLGHLPTALAVLGVAVAAAPLVFQMFSRAPAGAEMIDDLRPLMTREKVTRMQVSFVTIAAMEGELRNVALPAVAAGTPTGTYPAVTAFTDTWGTISGEMAPMIGAMADNLEEFAGIDALPPFWMFPWFFVVPGLLASGLAVAGGRAPRRRPEAAPAT